MMIQVAIQNKACDLPIHYAGGAKVTMYDYGNSF